MTRNMRSGNTTSQLYCHGCGKSVKVTNDHTLPRHVTSDESGTLLKENTRPTFQRLQHKTADLLTIIEQFSSREPNAMTTRQKAALKSFEQWLGPINVKRSKTKLIKYCKTLDQILFAGSLGRFTDVQFEPDMDQSRKLGYTSLPGTDASGKPLLNIRISALTIAGNIDDDGAEVLEVLLHEMIHAFLMLFHCHCVDCLKESATEIGYTGHGKTWEKMANQIQQAASAKLNLRVHGIESGVYCEQKEVRKYKMLDFYRLVRKDS